MHFIAFLERCVKEFKGVFMKIIMRLCAVAIAVTALSLARGLSIAETGSALDI